MKTEDFFWSVRQGYIGVSLILAIDKSPISNRHLDVVSHNHLPAPALSPTRSSPRAKKVQLSSLVGCARFIYLRKSPYIITTVDLESWQTIVLLQMDYAEHVCRLLHLDQWKLYSVQCTQFSLYCVHTKLVISNKFVEKNSHLTQDTNGVNNLSKFVSDSDFNYDELTSMDLSTIIT